MVEDNKLHHLSHEASKSRLEGNRLSQKTSPLCSADGRFITIHPNQLPIFATKYSCESLQFQRTQTSFLYGSPSALNDLTEPFSALEMRFECCSLDVRCKMTDNSASDFFVNSVCRATVKKYPCKRT